MMTDEIKREYVFATYVTSKNNRNNDMLVVKEILHKGNKTKRNLRFIENYQRDIYITKPDYRDHNDKKEYEDIGKLNKFTCNNAMVPKVVFRELKGYMPTGYIDLAKMENHQYIYGTDVSTPTLLANEYRERYPKLSSENTLAVMDYETDVVKGHGMIISGVLSYKDKVHLAITKDFLDDLKVITKEDIFNALNLHLKEYVIARNIVFTIDIVDKASDVVISLFKRAHAWEFDFLGFWNIKFDITKIIEALRYDNIDPAYVFSNPRVPNEYKYFRFKEDSLYKMKANGTRTKKHPLDLWHVVTAPAGFMCICLMALFRAVRGRDQLRSSYSLDSVLHDLLNLGKLKFDNMAEGLIKMDWHMEMQSKHKVEYMVYMTFDGISVELLDDKTKDAARSLRGFIGISEISKLKSNPKRLSDDIYFILLKEDKILASTSDHMRTPLDDKTPTLNKWIIALPSELEHEIGYNLINEYPLLNTNITTYAYDVDVKGAYPTADSCLNVSKSTTRYETCGIKGLPPSKLRSVGINLTNVKSNCITLAQDLYCYPELDALLDEFKKEITI